MAERDRPLHELLSRDMVDIYVGSEQTHWTLHEKLLCQRSKFFRDTLKKDSKGKKNHTVNLPDDDDDGFKLFVAWLYSASIPKPKEEKDLGPLFDLYIMAEKWEIRKLVLEVMEDVRNFYHTNDSWPGLRRVQYVYGNTEVESPMRQLLVSCVARMLVLGSGMPAHWEKALRRNGQLAVDVILCVQKWHIEPQNVPDAREESVVPIVEEAEQKVEIKREEEGADDETANGVKQEEEEEEEVEGEGEEGEEVEEGEEEGEVEEGAEDGEAEVEEGAEEGEEEVQEEGEEEVQEEGEGEEEVEEEGEGEEEVEEEGEEEAEGEMQEAEPEAEQEDES